MVKERESFRVDGREVGNRVNIGFPKIQLRGYKNECNTLCSQSNNNIPLEIILR